MLKKFYEFFDFVRSIFIRSSIIVINVKNIIFSSTAAVYGNPQYLPVDENHQTNPINYYGFTKLMVENTLSWYKNLKGFNFIALRYFNAAGYDKKKRFSFFDFKE